MIPMGDLQREYSRLRPQIDAAIDRGAMGPLASFGLDRGELERRLARCEQCPELAPAGCRNVQPPCKQWTLWRQSLLLGSCQLFAGGNSIAGEPTNKVDATPRRLGAHA